MRWFLVHILAVNNFVRGHRCRERLTDFFQLWRAPSLNAITLEATEPFTDFEHN